MNFDHYVLAIDPGDIHVGWAEYNSADPPIRAGEWTADEAVERVGYELKMGIVGMLDVVLVVEEFVLYPGQDRRTTWTKQSTSEMIGALKHVARQLEVPVVEQGANIKKPTRAQLPARGIHQVGSGTHARDAELHLYYYILKEGIWNK